MASATPISSAGWLSAAGGFIQLLANRESARAQRIAGESARVAAQFNALQAERQGGIAIALAQRQAAEERRLGRFAASRALAVAASSGGGVSDPTIVRLLANAHGEATYRANVALYEGEERDRQLRMEAILGRAAGADAQAAAEAKVGGLALASLGTIARTGVSMYTRYGQGGPSGDSALIGDYTKGHT